MEGLNTSPKIHAELHDRQNKSHTKEMYKNNFPSIDLIIVNFYPFQRLVTESKNPKINRKYRYWWPTMVRLQPKILIMLQF